MLKAPLRWLLFAALAVLPQVALALVSPRALAPTRAKLKLLEGGGEPQPFNQPKVPTDQQPVLELRELRAEPFFDWAELAWPMLRQRLLLLYAGAFAFSLPIALSTYGSLAELPLALLGSSVGASGVTFAFVLRLRIGWSYVSGRLRDSTVYYERNQRGYEVKKDESVRARDKLIDEFEVQPMLRKVDDALKAGGLALALSALALHLLSPAPYAQLEPSYLSSLSADDALAAREQRRAQAGAERPSFCESRYYQAVAGAESNGFCK